MTEKHGIKETKEVIIFLTKIGVSISKCVIDKKFNMLEFTDDIMCLPAAIEDIGEIGKEIMDLILRKQLNYWEQLPQN